MKRQIIFINRFFYPDLSATSQMLSDLAFELAAQGRDVRVLTTTGTYEGSQGELSQYEEVRGVKIHRVARTRFGRKGLLGRAADFLTMYSAFALSLSRVASAGDVVVAKTDPPLLSIAIIPIAKARGLNLINWLQDIYPEIAERLGIRVAKGPIGFVLQHLRNFSLRAAAANVAIGDRMAQELVSLGTPANLVHVIPNWCDDQAITPSGADENPLRQAWGLQGKFIVGYSGNLGRAHEYETLLTAARLLQDDDDIRFLFIGGGHLTSKLEKEVAALGLRSFQFRPYQENSLLKFSLGLPDVHWLSLRPEMEGFIVPSKIYGIAASGRAVIAVTHPDGEIARYIRAFECGIVVAPGDGTALADGIRALKADPTALTIMGQQSRAMLDRHFSRRYSIEKWGRLISAFEPVNARGSNG